MNVAAERAEELIVDWVTEGLDSVQEQELNGLLTQCPEVDAEGLELAAAAVELACLDIQESMPTTVKLRLVDQAREHFSSATTEPAESPGHLVSFPEPPSPSSQPAVSRPPSRAGWWLAAACFLLAVIGWWPKQLVSTPDPAVSQVETAPVQIPAAKQSPAEARAGLLADAQDVIQVAWTAGEDPTAIGAGGDVIWSPERQRGFMRFSGLSANDPKVEQYQLWIFDAAQDERYPVDGGVFDITSSGEVIVEIDAKLAIVEPTLFAITVEKPGGVVVSDRSRLPLLASVGQG